MATVVKDAERKRQECRGSEKDDSVRVGGKPGGIFSKSVAAK
jgi:hypothetical protein